MTTLYFVADSLCYNATSSGDKLNTVPTSTFGNLPGMVNIYSDGKGCAFDVTSANGADSSTYAVGESKPKLIAITAGAEQQTVKITDVPTRIPWLFIIFFLLVTVIACHLLHHKRLIFDSFTIGVADDIAEDVVEALVL